MQSLDSQLDIEALIDRQRPGFTLEQPFYTAPEIFAREFQDILSRKWLFVDHASRVHNAGEFIAYQIARESIVITRDRQHQLHAWINVCAHRGSRVCLAPHGRVRTFTCPYHGWRYDLDGHCINARGMPDDATHALALRPCAIRELKGLIYICIDHDAAPQFDVIASHLAPYLKAHGTAQAKIAHRTTIHVNANWKLVTDNFLECSHCHPAHPRYTATYSHVDAYERGGAARYRQSNEAWSGQMTAAGVPGGTLAWNEFREQPHYARRRPIGKGHQTLSKNGAPCAPLMGRFTDYDGGDTVLWLQPLHIVWAANDYVTAFRFTPIDTHRTDIEIIWLVDEHATEGIDYDIHQLTWLWDATAREDAQLLTGQHNGIRSQWYRPGPYTDIEHQAARATQWYLEQLSLAQNRHRLTERGQ